MFVPLYVGLFGTQYGVDAGPYYKKPDGVPGLKLAKEIKAEKRLSVSIPDYGLPESEAEVLGAVALILHSAANQKPLYVGCMGGIGRTGMLLAIAAKALGESNPVGYIRAVYNSHAVETEEQKKYVALFNVSPLSMLASSAKFKMLF